MGMAPVAHILFNKFMNFNPKNPDWANRDRFVLSNGHGCMLQYALLHLFGYDVTMDDLKSFRVSDYFLYPSFSFQSGEKLTNLAT